MPLLRLPFPSVRSALAVVQHALLYAAAGAASAVVTHHAGDPKRALLPTFSRSCLSALSFPLPFALPFDDEAPPVQDADADADDP